MFLVCAPFFGAMTFMRGGMLIPFVIILSSLGAYLSAAAWQNIVVLMVIGVFGYFLRKYRWPRPPFVIGLVLGPIAEDSLNKALAIWGPTFFLRPLSLVFIVLIYASVGFYFWRHSRPRSGMELHFDI
jgi:TctA family transporter